MVNIGAITGAGYMHIINKITRISYCNACAVHNYVLMIEISLICLLNIDTHVKRIKIKFFSGMFYLCFEIFENFVQIVWYSKAMPTSHWHLVPLQHESKIK